MPGLCFKGKKGKVQPGIGAFAFVRQRATSWLACLALLLGGVSGFADAMVTEDPRLGSFLLEQRIFNLTNGTRRVVVGFTTNRGLAGVNIGILAVTPPDHDWRVRVRGEHYGLTYYSAASEPANPGTWMVFPGGSLHVRWHIYAVTAVILLFLLMGAYIAWWFIDRAERRARTGENHCPS